MDKRERLKRVIERNIILSCGKINYYQEISDKKKLQIAKNFDVNINTNDIVAFIDTSLTKNSRLGLIFTLTGVYSLEGLMKPYYFNYQDIESMAINYDKKGKVNLANATLCIILSNDNFLKIGHNNFYKDNLKNLLCELKNKFSEWNDIVCIKPSGEVGKIKFSNDEKIKCNSIIHSASVAAGAVGTGLAQIPLADNSIITPIQITMITSLGAVFGVPVTEGVIKGILGGATASVLGRGTVQVLVGWIPGVGNAINTATAAGVTEAIGWMAASHFFDLQQQDKVKSKGGYSAASEEYEIKLRKQADEFLNQTKIYEEQVYEYHDLLLKYEIYISELERKVNKSEKEYNNLIVSKNQYNALCQLVRYKK